jgi:Metallo-beta-lactamase superfamily
MIRDAAVTAEITLDPLRGNVTVLGGSGGNVAVLTGPDGKLLVDAGIAVSRQNMANALASLGPDPIRHLINSIGTSTMPTAMSGCIQKGLRSLRMRTPASISWWRKG